MGAHRRQLIGQFMGESILPTLGALLIAVLLVVLLLPAFNALTARDMSLHIADNGGLPATLLFIGLAVGVLSGSYPAFMMSAFHPIGMMKGMPNRRAGKTTLRNVLVVIQFSIALVLVMGTLVVQQQLGYIQRANTGFARDHIVSIEVKDPALYARYAALKQTLLSHRAVRSVTASQDNPTRIDSQSGTREWEGAEDGQNIAIYYTTVQHGFVDQLGIELVEGRDFSASMGTDEQEGILINETLRRELGWETAVGKWINFRRREARV
jgi:putative ABC transport system permease protein